MLATAVFLCLFTNSHVSSLGVDPKDLQLEGNSVKYFKKCTGGPSPDAVPNLNPLYTQESLQQVKTCTNGILYTAGSTSNTSFHILKASGSAYDVGYAHGSCLKDEVSTFQSEFWDYLSSSLAESWNLPQVVANDTIKTLIDAQIEKDRIFIHDYWFDELEGLSDGSGVPFDDLLRFHVSSEMNGFHCSMIGAWGDSVINANSDGTLLQLRALDYDVDGPQKNYPLITVYDIKNDDNNNNNNNKAENSHIFATIGAASFIGSITGISSKHIGICEIGVSCPDNTFYTGNDANTTANDELGPAGYPFVFMLRDVLQFDDNLTQATDRIVNNHRTVDLILGVGDGKITQTSTDKDKDNDDDRVPFHGFQYSKDVCNVFNDTNLEPYNETWHPKIQDIVYWGMDWWIQDYDETIATQLNNYYGNLTAEIFYQHVTPIAQTGNFHIAIYDYANERLLVSFHSKNYGESNQEEDNAYNRQFTVLPFDILFS